MNKTLDLCEIFSTKVFNPMVNALRLMAQKSLKFLTKCPINPGAHKLEKVRVPDNLLPLNLFYQENTIVMSCGEMFEKLPSKKRIDIFKMQVSAKIRKSPKK